MKIRKLQLKNFRCFETLEINLHPQYTVLIGINGAGKSTILDALSIALGGFLIGMDGIKSNHIASEDAHYKTFSVGSKVEAQEQFPVVVAAEADFGAGQNPVSWRRELNGIKKRTTHGNAKYIVNIARELQEKVREGDQSCVLPLIAYYGTGRLWMQKRGKKEASSKTKKLNRQMGYMDCLDVASNEKQMMKWFEEMTYIQLQEEKSVPELDAVKKALRMCYMSVDPAIKNAQFSYNVKSQELEITIYRDEKVEKLPVRMLSDGEKGIISLVADIAYRMALLNPNYFENVLNTPGVVLIDEIDMHLHPLWQKKIISDLIRIFPKVQFIVTTHSPSILTNVKKEHIRIINHYQIFDPQNTTYGRDLEDILREVMGVNVRPEQVIRLMEDFDQAIDKEDFLNAKNLLEKMRGILGNNAKEVVKSQIVLDIETLG